MDYREIHVCITFRQLIFALIDLSNKDVNGVIIFLVDYQKISFDVRYRLIRNFCKIKFFFLKETGLVNEFSCFSERFPGLLRRNFSISLQPLECFFGAKKWVPKFLKKYYFDKAYIYHSGPFTAKIMRAVSPRIILREDGLSNYIVHRMTIIKSISRAFLLLSPRGQVWGEERWVDELQVENPEMLPNRVKYKAKKISFEKIASQLSFNVRSRLLHAFNLELSLPDLNSIKKTCLLLTQPIDSVGFCDLNEKVFLYKRISEKFLSLGYMVFMKNHPKEIPFSLPGVSNLAKEFPVELISFVSHVRFSYCVALCSTSMEGNIGKIASRNLQIIPLQLFSEENVFLWRDLIDNIHAD